jgi:Xaa-Pro dipeptidase
VGLFPGRRLLALQEQLRLANLDAAVIEPSVNLRYFAGIDWPRTQRCILVVPAEGKAALIVPEFTLARVSAVPAEVILLGWSDPRDLIASVVESLPNPASRVRIAVADLRASTLIEIGKRTVVDEWVDSSSMIDGLRIRKDDSELAALAEAAHRADRALEVFVGETFVGRTERDLASRLMVLLIEEGLSAPSVHAMIAAGPASADLHHLAGEARVEPDSPVLIDLSGAYQGYQADVTRTVFAGEPDEVFRRAYEAVVQASRQGFASIRPAVAAGEADRRVRQVIEEAGFGAYFIHRAGHGIGLELHEEPSVEPGNDRLLEEGMAVSVQPAVYLPGRFGIRVEDVGVITASGCERLSASDREVRTVQ